MHTIPKVVAYIVRDGRLLVFTHADDERFEQSGIQVPAGTIREGESPHAAVLHEAAEETGLSGLRIRRYLGAGTYDMRPYADAIHLRQYFHLDVDVEEVPERWVGYERGDGELPPIRFECFWLPLAGAHVLAAGLNHMAVRGTPAAVDAALAAGWVLRISTDAAHHLVNGEGFELEIVTG